jgi:hypothetical protein
MKRVTFSAAILVLGIGLAGLSAPAAFAAQANTAQVTSMRPADVWFDGGTYPTVYDCNQAGQQELRTGMAQYRCNPAIAPDGSIGVWQLWVEYP